MRLAQSLRLDQQLWTNEDKLIFKNFPESYQAFLHQNNGGFVESDDAWFSIPIPRQIDGQTYPTIDNAIEEWCCFLGYQNTVHDDNFPTSILCEHFDRHEGEGFLPENVFVIARCIQSSLICLSINKADFGAIYYWEWYWQYPWFKPFFEHRLKDVDRKYPDASNILSDKKHVRYSEVFNAFNYATLVKITDSFQSFLDSLKSNPEAS